MNFYLTFGQKYRDEQHPSGFKVHPDGWFRIFADDAEKAHGIAFNHLGPNWCMIYSENDFDPKLYPRGEMVVLGG